jgi:hypothetical protein
MYASCSLKCLKRVELFYVSILIIVVSHVTLLTLIAVLRCVSVVPISISKTSSFSIATCS